MFMASKRIQKKKCCSLFVERARAREGAVGRLSVNIGQCR